MKRSIAGIFALAALLMAVSMMALPAAAQDDDAADTRTITVTGFGRSAGAPDVAYVSLGLQITDENPSTAFSRANDGIAAVRDAIIALGIAPEDLQTTGFNMWMQDTFDPQSGIPTGGRTYNAQNLLTITVRDVAITGNVVTAGIEAGANIINGLNFGIADTSSLSQTARVNAIQDARERAAQIAGALGLTVGEPLRVDESVQGGASCLLYTSPSPRD